MGVDVGLLEVSHWITIVFPSLSTYTKLITPAIFVLFSVFTFFSNIIPEPGHIFPIPSDDDIKAELKHKGRIVYTLTRVSAEITQGVNRVIKTRFYKFVYMFITLGAKIIGRIKGDKSKGKIKQITKPKPYKVDLDTFSSIDDKQP